MLAARLLSLLILVGCATPASPSPPPFAYTPLSRDGLAHATYQGIQAAPLTLVDGSFPNATAPAVTLLNTAQGDLTGDGIADAAALLGETGGSGQFVFVAALVEEGGRAVNVATVPVGNQWMIKSLTIEAGEIVLDGLRPPSAGPQTCACDPVVRRYALQGGTLALVTEITAHSAP